MNPKDPRIEHSRKVISEIINADAFSKVRKKTQEDIEREKFINLVLRLEQAYMRSVLLDKDFAIDLVKYDEEFYAIIDDLLLIHYGKNAADFIIFYVYDRINDDGTINSLEGPGGFHYQLNNPMDLWEIVQQVRNPLPKPRNRTTRKNTERQLK